MYPTYPMHSPISGIQLPENTWNFYGYLNYDQYPQHQMTLNPEYVEYSRMRYEPIAEPLYNLHVPVPPVTYYNMNQPVDTGTVDTDSIGTGPIDTESFDTGSVEPGTPVNQPIVEKSEVYENVEEILKKYEKVKESLDNQSFSESQDQVEEDLPVVYANTPVNIEDYKEIDTISLCKQIWIYLKSSIIKQSTLANCLLSRAQGTLSDILHYPKPWDELTLKGRDNYIRLDLWFNSNQRERLMKLSHEEVSRALGVPPRNTSQWKNKKAIVRTRFTFQQKQILMKKHLQNPNGKIKYARKVAEQLGLDTNVVLHFFDNQRRYRQKIY